MKDKITNINYDNFKVLVVGDVMLDRYKYGEISRISPEYPVPVFNYKREEIRLGGSANTAKNIKAIGCNVDVMGVVSDDKYGRLFIKLCQEAGIDTSLVLKDNSFVTTIKTRYLNQNNTQIIRVDEEEVCHFSEEIQNILLEKVNKRIDEYDAIFISDYLKGFLSVDFTQKLITLANKHNVKTFIDVKDKNREKYKNCYLLKPNLNELRLLTQTKVETEEEIKKAAISLKNQLNVKNILVTLGSRGMLLVDEQEKISYLPTQAKEVFDVTGAGDTVLAYLGIMNIAGFNLEESMFIANKAAGVKVGFSGTISVSLEMLLNSFNCIEKSKIVTQENLKQILKKIKNKKIVFTNGCFDIIHAGHISYLKEAKSYGDILIVGVNSDASVKRLKGENRPINILEDRMIVLSELTSVDFVVSFDEDTPYNLIKLIEPNVLVKGGDYKPENIVGYDIIVNNGGKVVTTKFKQGLSSTNILKKIGEK